MEDDYEFEPSQSEIDEIYNNDYWLNVELPKILREPKKRELKIAKVKRVKLIATIFDPAHDFNEDWEELEIEMTIPNYEWTRLIEEGQFSIYFDNVIEGYKKWIEEMTKFECSITFKEIEQEKSSEEK